MTFTPNLQQWWLRVEVAGSHDIVDAPSLGWAEDDRQIDVGTVPSRPSKAGKAVPRPASPSIRWCFRMAITPSGDPILQAWSTAYIRLFSVRSGEKPLVLAITPTIMAAPAGAEGKKHDQRKIVFPSHRVFAIG